MLKIERRGKRKEGEKKTIPINAEKRGRIGQRKRGKLNALYALT